jgi:hypothetical protein
VIIPMSRITPEQRRSESELWSRFEAQRAQIFGALLDCVARGLRQLPRVRLASLPRMADFALWSVATGAFKPGAFITAFEHAASEATEAVIEGDPVTVAVAAFMAARDGWNGTLPNCCANSVREIELRLSHRLGRRGRASPAHLASGCGWRPQSWARSASRWCSEKRRTGARRGLSRSPRLNRTGRTDRTGRTGRTARTAAVRIMKVDLIPREQRFIGRRDKRLLTPSGASEVSARLTKWRVTNVNSVCIR